MTNVIFTPEQYAAACARFKKKLAARQAAREVVERIVAGAPRSSFGNFVLSFDEIVPTSGFEAEWDDVASDFVAMCASLKHTAKQERLLRESHICFRSNHCPHNGRRMECL